MSERSESTATQYGPRLFRGVGLVVAGAAMHMLLPGRSVMVVPDLAQQQLVYVESKPEPRPLVVEHTTVFAPRVTPLEERLVPVHHAIVPVSTLGGGADFATALTGSIAASRSDTAASIATSGSDPAAEDAGEPRASEAPQPPAPLSGVPYTKTMYTTEIGRIPAPTAPLVFRSTDSAVRRSEEPVGLGTAPEPTPSEEQLVRRLLDEYAGALERLDVQAAKSVYPNVDGKALKKAFEQLSAQRVTLQACGIKISGSTANARCHGSAAYHPKIGSGAVQIASREWTFDLSKTETDWRIVNTIVR
jgi:hypothetical protein